MKIKNISENQLEHVNKNIYRCRDPITNKIITYVLKLNCDNCNKTIFRRKADQKKTKNNFCCAKCKTEFLSNNDLYKKYELGKEYQTKEKGIIRIWSGTSWIYKKEFNCSYCNAKILRENRKRQPTYHFCNKDCEYKYNNPKSSKIMEKINDNNFYYLLGLIATDGCLTYPTENLLTSGYEIKISLKTEDEELLQRIYNIFGGYINNKIITTVDNYFLCKWSMHNKEFIEYLKSIGITRNKSLTLNIDNWFNSLSEEHKRHFVRGCIDGDGSVCVNKKQKLTVNFTSGSLSFCKLISSYLQNIVKSEKQISIDKRGNNLSYSIGFTHNQSIKICNELYNVFKDDLYLSRKYENCKPFLNNIDFFKDYLSPKYSISEQKKEFERIKNNSGVYSPFTKSNRIVLSHQPHFYEIENNLWFRNKNNLRNRLIQNRIKFLKKDKFSLTDRELLRGFKIMGLHFGFSHFNPLIIKKFIEDYKITSIYDFCGGWGHRLLGAYNIKYIYNDLDRRTYEGVINISETFKLKDKIFYNKDSAKFIPNEEYEAVFTCPPYYNTEIYQNKTFSDMNDYLNWWDKSVSNSLKLSVKYFAYVIGAKYKNDTETICKNLGLIKNNEFILETKKSHLASTNRKEHLLIFDRNGN